MAPPLIWVAVLFAASSVPGTSLPSTPIPGGDKLIHAFTYAVLGVLLARALVRRTPARLLLAIGLAAAYGALDELYQSLVPGRHPDVWDAGADAAGALFGVMVWTATGRRFERTRSRPSPRS